MQTSFRNTAIYFILSRYVLSFHFDASGRSNEHYAPPPSIMVQASKLPTHLPHRWSPILLQASHHHYYYRGNRMLRDERQRRRQRILTWLPRKVRSTLRGIIAMVQPQQQDKKDEQLITMINSPTVPIDDKVARTAVTSINDLLSNLDTSALAASSPVSKVAKINNDRSETAASTTDLTGTWRLMVTSDFKQQYDKYLKGLGQPMLVRSVAISIIGMTTEETRQDDNGRSLWIKGTNPRGVWERILRSSVDDIERFEIQTIDNETVQAEAWWDENGSRHRSWLRGVSKYGGGSFESVRYLESPDVLVCESAFYPDNNKREIARVTWRFARTSSTGS